MTNDEIDMVLDFLDTLTDYQANAGCNDYWFPADWSEERKNNILEPFWKERRAHDPEYMGYSDHDLTYYLMNKLKGMKK